MGHLTISPKFHTHGKSIYTTHRQHAGACREARFPSSSKNLPNLKSWKFSIIKQHI